MTAYLAQGRPIATRRVGGATRENTEHGIADHGSRTARRAPRKTYANLTGTTGAHKGPARRKRERTNRRTRDDRSQITKRREAPVPGREPRIACAIGPRQQNHGTRHEHPTHHDTCTPNRVHPRPDNVAVADHKTDQETKSRTTRRSKAAGHGAAHHEAKVSRRRNNTKRVTARGPS